MASIEVSILPAAAWHVWRATGEVGFRTLSNLPETREFYSWRNGFFLARVEEPAARAVGIEPKTFGSGGRN